jgi:hypothetical protein
MLVIAFGVGGQTMTGPEPRKLLLWISRLGRCIEEQTCGKLIPGGKLFPPALASTTMRNPVPAA